MDCFQNRTSLINTLSKSLTIYIINKTYTNIINVIRVAKFIKISIVK